MSLKSAEFIDIWILENATDWQQVGEALATAKALIERCLAYARTRDIDEADVLDELESNILTLIIAIGNRPEVEIETVQL